MKKMLFLSLLLAIACLSAGCNTLKGAGEGFSKDWKKLAEFDQWLQEKAW